MREVVSFCIAMFVLVAIIEAAPYRIWKSAAGTEIEARLIERDEDLVVLELKAGGKRLPVKLAQLSAADREFIAALPDPASLKGIEELRAEAGAVSPEIKCVADARWSYHLYLPKQFNMGQKWPVMFVMAPGGGEGGGEIHRYRSGADRLGCILAISVQSKDGFGESGSAVQAMAEDAFRRLPVSPHLGLASGMDGGSRMAHLLAESDKRISGVLACGTGNLVQAADEDQARPAKLRAGTYVYSLIGSNCFNRSEAVRSHAKYPAEYRLRFFPGGHEWAEGSLLAQGMARVYGAALQSARDPKLDPLRRAYAETMLKWAGEFQDAEPWETYYWATYLAKFNGHDEVSEQAVASARKLAGHELVKRGLAAESAVLRFCAKHYNRPISVEESKKRVPAREAEAGKLSDHFPGMPQIGLLRALAEPAL